MRLRRHLKGFSLVCDGGARVVVAHLYGFLRASDLDRLTPPERIFGHELTMEQALQEVVARAERMGYRISICGDRRREPVLRVWWRQERRPGRNVRVSLPDGRWIADPVQWEQLYPGLWACLEDAFRGSGPRVAVKCTSPGGSVEGQVIFRISGADVFLIVHPISGGGQSGLPPHGTDDVRSWFDGLLTFGPAGGQASGAIRARRFTTLMRRLSMLVNRLAGEVGLASGQADCEAVVCAVADR